jgi:hypothetical protein
MLFRLLTGLVAVCMFAGCGSMAVGNRENEITASARYVRIPGALPEAKGALAFLADEAGTLTLTEAQADAALAQLSKVTQQEAQYTTTATVPQGYAMRIKLTGPRKATGSDSSGSSVLIRGMTFTQRDDVFVELGISPHGSSEGVIPMEIAMAVTACDGFVEYGGTLVTIAPGGAGGNPPPTTVRLPKGFYRPIYSTYSMKADARMAAGAVVVLRADLGKRDAPEGRVDQEGRPIKSVPPETMLVFLTTEVGSAKR